MSITSSSPRVRVPLIFALAVTVLALGAAQASAARYAYTGNYDTDTVSVIDTATNQVVGSPIPVGDQPSTLAVTPNGKTLYVGAEGSEGGNNVTVVNTQSNQAVGTIPLTYEGSDHPASTIAISPDGKTAYVVSYEVEGILVIDLQTNQIVGPVIPVGGSPWGVAFSPDGSVAYATDDEEDKIEVINTATRDAFASIPVGENPRNVVFSPDGKIAYVVNEESEDVSVIDTATRQVLGDPIPVGEEPWGVALTPNGGRLYVSNLREDSVTVIDTATRQVLGDPIPTGVAPYELVATPDGRFVYVADYEGGTDGEGGVTVINTLTNQASAFNVPGGPWQIAIVPDQSPIPSLTAKASTKKPLQIGFTSTTVDPDGTVASFNWSFGDGATALNGGPAPTHTYAQAGTYAIGLTAIDNEGCSTNMVFTGRTAFCSGAAAAAQPLTVKAPNNFKFGKLIRNKKKGTAKLKVKLPSPGKFVLSGAKVKPVKRSAQQASTVTLNIRPKPKAKKQLGKKGSAKLRIKVKFTPTGGKAKTKGRTVKLIKK
jgi:YVTN family beta-propeller protein